MCGSRAAFQQNNLQNEQKLSELQKGGSMYKKWLGLEFERVEGARLHPRHPPNPHPRAALPPPLTRPRPATALTVGGGLGTLL